MMVRTDQLLHIAEATGSNVHQQWSEAETDGRKKVSAVTETISCLILPFLQEWLDQSHDRATWTPLKLYVSMLKCSSKYGPEVILHMVL